MPFLSSESRNIKTCDDRTLHFPLQSESTFCRYAIETLPAHLDVVRKAVKAVESLKIQLLANDCDPLFMP